MVEEGKANIRLIFASDLHGSNSCFRKFLQAAREYKVDAALIGGDISGKFLTRIRRVGAFDFEGELAGSLERVCMGEKLVQLESDIANTGSYSIRVNPGDPWHDSATDETIALVKIRQRLHSWMWWASRSFKPAGIRLVMICGNDDPWELDDVLAESDFVENPERQVVLLGNYQVIGESTSNKTPFKCPRDLPEEEIEQRLRDRLRLVADPRQTLFLVHTPPFDSTLDIAPQLNSDLRIQHKGGHTRVGPIGSTAVRTIITEFQPLLSFHGHVHESPGFVQIGETLCCNPGSEYDSSILRAVLVEVRGNEVVKRNMIQR